MDRFKPSTHARAIAVQTTWLSVTRRPILLHTVALAALLLLSLLTLPSFGQVAEQSMTSTLSIQGRGTVLARPDQAVMLVSINGEAEVAGDALVKFRDGKKQALEQIKQAGIEGLTVEPMGVSFSVSFDQQQINMMRQGRMQAGNIKPNVVVTEQLQLVLTGIDKLSTDQLVGKLINVIDLVEDMGLTPGGMDRSQIANYGYNMQTMSLFAYMFSNRDELEKQAMQKAVEDGKANAKQLARQTGVKIGRVVSVRHSANSPYQHHSNSNFMAFFNQMQSRVNAQTGHNQALSGTFGPVPIGVSVYMTFEILGGESE